MAASAWQLYNSGKRYIGNGTITLGAGSFKMALARSTASAGVSTFTLSTFNQITSAGFEISATGGYTSGGKELVTCYRQVDGRCFRKADEVYLLNRGADFYSVAFVLEQH
jgi:hypothetical protein